jgi:hypothetical protein
MCARSSGRLVVWLLMVGLRAVTAISVTPATALTARLLRNSMVMTSLDQRMPLVGHHLHVTARYSVFITVISPACVLLFYCCAGFPQLTAANGVEVNPRNPVMGR